MLRRFTGADVENLADLEGDPDVVGFITGGRPTPHEEIRRDILPAFLRYYSF